MARVAGNQPDRPTGPIPPGVGGLAPPDRRGVVLPVARMAGSLLAALRRGPETPRAGRVRRDRPPGILPLVVRQRGESRSAGSACSPSRCTTGARSTGRSVPIPELTLAAGLEHVRRTPRDWDILELRWQGAPAPTRCKPQRAMLAAGFQALSDRVGSARRWSIWTARGSRTGRRARARGCGDFATPSASSPSKARFPTCVTARWASRTTTARPAGICTTPARKLPGEAGRARPPTARRCRTRRCAAFSARCIKPPPRPAPST